MFLNVNNSCDMRLVNRRIRCVGILDLLLLDECHNIFGEVEVDGSEFRVDGAQKLLIAIQ